MIHQLRMTRNKLFQQLTLAGLILITLLLYYPPFDWAFVGDDYVQFDYIKEVIADPTVGISLFNPYYLPWYYRPLQLIWFSFLEAIFHFVPQGFYWVALLFHALAISLVYRVTRQFGLGWQTAVLAAVLFAIHSHWVDVVSWLSSIAILQAAVFSLAALSAWLSYLRRPSTRQLLLTLLFCFLTFLSHEEGILLPPFLLAVLLVKRIETANWLPKKLKMSAFTSALSKREALFFAVLALLTLAYLYFQFTRPNLTIDITSRETAEWLTYFTWPKISGFILVTVFRFTFIFRLLAISGWAASLFAGAVLVLLVMWFWWGSRTVRLGLTWLLLHVVFIYWALWTQLPELYAGRHIYQGMFGLVLAVGASLEILLTKHPLPQRAQSSPRKKEKTLRSQRPLQFILVMILALVTAVSLHHINQTRLIQQQWLDNVTEEATAREQLATLFPAIHPENHFFAVRFPIAPQFTRSVVQLWYDTPLERPGGSLDHLRSVDQITRDFVVLDYADGQIYNLMPELQEHDETIFLWAQPSQRFWLEENGSETAVPNPDNTLPIVEAVNGNQLALKMTPQNGRWLSHKITITIPENSELHTAVLPQPGLRYRLRLITTSGEETILFDSAGTEGQGWQVLIVPVEEYWGTAVTLNFELFSSGVAEDTSGYWGNPRLVID